MALLGAKVIALFVALTVVASSKTYQPCELAEALVKKHGFKTDSVASWVCLAKFSSGFKTSAVEGPLSDGSYSYGIFQINAKYCLKGGKEYCGVPCSDLLASDLTSSARCALKIFNKHGFNAWNSWKNDCKGRDVGQYVRRCSLKSKLAKALGVA